MIRCPHPMVCEWFYNNNSRSLHQLSRWWIVCAVQFGRSPHPLPLTSQLAVAVAAAAARGLLASLCLVEGPVLFSATETWVVPVVPVGDWVLPTPSLTDLLRCNICGTTPTMLCLYFPPPLLASSLQRSLLQSVIRNLVDSEDDLERQTQRKKLESDLDMTSERLDTLVQGV